MKKKTIALLLALTLLLGVTAGGTLAWLLDTTEEVKNVFTTSDVDIELTESPDLDLQMIPGYSIDKDPTVTVKAVSEKCYVFVKVEKSATTYTVKGMTEPQGFDDYLEYTVDAAWTQLENTTGVYWKVFEDTNADQTQPVLTGSKVSVKRTVTKEMMNAVGENKPTLAFTAYACQYMKNNTEYFTAAEAWENIKTTNAG